MIGLWALLQDDLVINVFEWEDDDIGSLNFGEGTELIRVPDEQRDDPLIGMAFINGMFVPPPKTPAQLAAEEAQRKRDNINKAQWEYSNASSKITAAKEQIEDQDFSFGATEETLNAEQDKWRPYRILLRAYLKESDGSDEPPENPYE